MNRKYKYLGPADSSVTLRVDGKDRDVMLLRGREVELPPEHEYVKTLVALDYLQPVDAQAEAAPSASARIVKGGK